MMNGWKVARLRECSGAVLHWAAAAASLTLMLALAACSFGPSGTPPAMPQPEHYGALAQPAQTVAAEGVSQRFVAGSRTLSLLLYVSATNNFPS